MKAAFKGVMACTPVPLLAGVGRAFQWGQSHPFFFFRAAPYFGPDAQELINTANAVVNTTIAIPGPFGLLLNMRPQM